LSEKICQENQINVKSVRASAHAINTKKKDMSKLNMKSKMLGGKLPTPEEPRKQKTEKNVDVPAPGVFRSKGGLFRGGLKAKRMAKEYSEKNPGKTGTAIKTKQKWKLLTKNEPDNIYRTKTTQFQGGEESKKTSKYQAIKKSKDPKYKGL